MDTTKFPTCYDRAVYELEEGTEIEIGDYTRGAEYKEFNKRVEGWIEKHPEHKKAFELALYSDPDDDYHPTITILAAKTKPVVNVSIKLTSMAILINGVDKWITINVSKKYAMELLKWFIKPKNTTFIACGEDWGSEYM